MTEHNDKDNKIVRSTFDTLRSDSEGVDTMKALRNVRDGAVSKQRWLRPAIGVASVAIIGAVGALTYQLSQDDSSTRTNSASQATDERPASIDVSTCVNNAQVTIEGAQDRKAADLIPREWEGQGSVAGTVKTKDGVTTFNADGYSLALHEPDDFVTLECTIWTGDEPAPSTARASDSAENTIGEETSSATDVDSEKEPVSPSTSFADLPCGDQRREEGTAANSVDHIFSIENLTSATCRRTVVTFGKAGSSGEAGSVQPGLLNAVADEGEALRFDLPRTWRVDDGSLFEVYDNFDRFSATGNGFVAVIADGARNPYLYVDQGNVSTTTYAVLANPARLIIDTRISAATARPSTSGGVYVQKLSTGEEIGDCCAVINGFAAQFEGVGIVELRKDEPGAGIGEGELVEADWYGKSLTSAQKPVENVSSVSYMAGANWLWAPFSLEVDNIPADDYKFVFVNDALERTELQPGDIHEVKFTVG